MPSQTGPGQRPGEPRTDATIFKIAHISDLHLAEEPSVPGFNEASGLLGTLAVWFRVAAGMSGAPTMTSHDPRCFRALMDALTGKNKYTDGGYDGYLVTGDIATTGTPNDMRAAAGILRREDGYAGGETLDAPMLPSEKVVLLPGNHDRYFGRTLSPTSAEFEREENFGANWSLGNPASGGKRRDVNHQVLTAANGTQLAVISGDFSFTRPSLYLWRYLGRGSASDETLEQMITFTDDYARKSIGVVWAVHFPPVKRGVRSFLRLERHEAVLRAAASCGVRTIFSGHTHIAGPYMEGTLDDRFSAIQIICASTACEYVKSTSSTQRSYFHIELEVRGKSVRLKSPVREMIYSRWLNRSKDPLSRAAIFCPAV